MPEIFSKNCKIQVIEYGSTSKPSISWKDLKSRIQDLAPSANIFKFAKRA